MVSLTELTSGALASPWNDKAMRDVREIGRYGMGDTEYSLREPSQIDEAKAIIKQAHERTT